MADLDANGIVYADYGTAFAEEWHQIFFHDPEGNIIEVHQQVTKKGIDNGRFSILQFEQSENGILRLTLDHEARRNAH